MNARSRLFSGLPTLLLCGSLAVAGTAAAVLPSAAVAAGREQAVDQAMRASGGEGRVLGVRRVVEADGRAYWAVKILTDGRVRVHKVPAD